MKIRMDFITNSSSSSYLIAFKNLTPQIDSETIAKYPFLKYLDTIMEEVFFGSDGSYETSESIISSDVKELQEYFLKDYGWNSSSFNELYDEDEYVRAYYDKCEEKIKKGYKILAKDVGYDDFRGKLFDILGSIDSDDFIMLKGENE